MFDHYECNGITVVDMRYDITENTVSTLREDMFSLIEAGTIHIVLDLKKVSYITSMGQSALCAVKKGLDPLGGWIRLANVKPDLLDILAITRLTGLFDIFESVEDAVSFEC